MKHTQPLTTLLTASVLLAGSFTSFNSSACSGDSIYLGSLCAFGGNFAIRGFARTDGQLLAVSSNTALFSILGTTYGGDGRTTFGLPDLRGRSAIGAGNGPGLPNYRLGQKGGHESVSLTTANLPAHSHSAATTITSIADDTGSSAVLRAVAGNASTNSPTANTLANSPRRENIYSASAPSVDMNTSAIDLTLNVTVTSEATTTVGNTGSGSPVSIRDPYLAVTWLIALQGLYPPRN